MRLHFDEELLDEIMKICREDKIPLGTLVIKLVREHVKMRLRNEGENERSSTEGGKAI